jgi:hypothetical protein
MKLFTTTEVNTTKQKQMGIDIRKANTVNEVLIKKRKELEKLEVEFEATISRQQAMWEKEKLEFIQSVNTLREEVKRLEDKRKQALIPLDEQKRKIQEDNDALWMEKAKFKEDKEEFEDELEFLEDKLSSVAERETEASRIAVIQQKEQSGIDSQKELVSKQSRDLSLAMFNFRKEAEIREKDIKTVEAVIILKQKALKDKELELAKIEQGFVNRERAIQDKYATLERTMNRLKIKQ